MHNDELITSDKCDPHVAQLLTALLQPDPELRLHKVMPDNGITKFELFTKDGLNFECDDKLLNLLLVQFMTEIKIQRSETVKDN